MTATLSAPAATGWTPEQWADWRAEVRRLAGQRDAFLLADSYQASEI